MAGAGYGVRRCSGPLGFVSLEAGWLVTDGTPARIMRGLMRTAEAVTEFP